MSRKERIDTLYKALKERLLVLDGAMGTAIQTLDPSEKDFGGATYHGCNENLVLTRPDLIEKIHGDYLRAGADIIETNTFGGTTLVLDEFQLGNKAYDINIAAAKMARSQADSFSSKEKPRFVAGSIGPTTKAISVTGGVTFEELMKQFYEQAKALFEGGVDYLLLETCQDTRNIKAAILGIQKLFKEKKEEIPLAISCTIEPMGTMLAGQGVDALSASMEHLDLLYVGLNCATGPEFMTDHIRTLSSLSKTRIACVPNAGLPDEEGNYLETPESMAKILKEFGEHGWLNLLGGCCGTVAKHIAAFSEIAKDLKPRVPNPSQISTLSGIDYLEITDEKRPILVGERTNVVGSRKFKRLIENNSYEEASEISRAQVKRGAHIIDICMANPDREELEDMDAFIEMVVKKVKVPLMIDSLHAEVIEKALTYCQGKAVINSINLEDGEDRFEQVVPLAKKYGAALVVGCIDEDPEQGMAVTKERKLAIAGRSFDLLTKKYGIQPQDIYFDALVFPCATGDKQYIGSAPETIEGVRLIKEKLPLCKTVLGISNVSFGLPPLGREVLNAVFLYHCTKAGLDLAIVNSEKLERYPSIPENERKLAENILWNRTPDCVNAFADFYRKAKPKKKKKDNLPLEKRLANYILEGSKDGLTKDLELSLQKYKPLEIINGPLMDGMEEVGRLFNNNELIVAEVLQSAEAMKAAVNFLEPHMEKKKSETRGKILLATVKGDVHDIGKNLVDIIIGNNGFEVINLGIKIPPEKLIEAVRKHKPDIIGLSGLLVKSAHQMVITAEDLTHAKITLPMLVGGAALSRNFVDKKISTAYGGLVEYAQDAMNGLDLVRTIFNPQKFKNLKESLKERRSTLDSKKEPSPGKSEAKKKHSPILHSKENLAQVPDYERHVLTKVSPDHIWPFINPLMLYGKHLGMKGSVVKRMMKGEREPSDGELNKAWEVYEVLEEIKEICRKGKMNPQAVYQFFQASSQNNQTLVFSKPQDQKPAMTFDFPRQKERGLCLSDYLLPEGSNLGRDNLCFFVVTAGAGILGLSRRFKEKGEFLKSHAIQALALETAEAFAEYLHSKIRGLWGFSDPSAMTMMERFQAKYRGKRYSFGYPACPDLKDQDKLFSLLQPKEMGVQLTEGHMMDPEASVSAMVFHHPQAEYFGV